MDIEISVQTPHDCRCITFTVSRDDGKVLNCSFGIFKKYVVGRDFSTECAPFFKELMNVWNNKIKTTVELDKYLLWIKEQKMAPIVPNTDHYPEPVVQPTALLLTNNEIVLYLLFMYRFVYTHRLAMGLHWIVIDLPPGVGKTFAIVKFCNIMQNATRRRTTCISTPTARTALLYEPHLRARTVHANFLIKPSPTAAFIPETESAMRILNSYSIFVFDEFSMYGVQLFLSLLTPLFNYQKMVVVIGDSCQMPPVMQSSLCWFQRTNNNHSTILRSFPFITYVQPDPYNVVLQRIGSRNENFRKLLLFLRGCISRTIELSNRLAAAKTTTEKSLSQDDKRPPVKRQRTGNERSVFFYS